MMLKPYSFASGSLVLVAGLSLSMAVVNGRDSGHLLAPAATAQEAPVGADTVSDLFTPVASVIRHPRCMNCHTTTDFPRQNDDRRRHMFNVTRGPDDHGTAGLQCSTCHSETNDDIGGVPGAPHWGLAPISMAWEYMSDAEICAQIKDRSRNGGKSIEQLHQHMVEDPLVLWAWQPGLHPGGEPRTQPPLDLMAWKSAIAAWVDAGAPCPANGASR